MKVAFFSIILNNHQASLADELYALLGSDFIFVELENLTGNDKKGAVEDFTLRPYLLQAWKSEDNHHKAYEIALTYDVCVFDGGFSFQKVRMYTGKITFEFSERWLKSPRNFLSPRLWTNILTHHLKGWHHKPLYKLCASAYAKKDQNLFGTFLNKCYKFGYFPQVLPDTYVHKKSTESNFVRLMWCARFINWKHPELAIQLAKRLKDAGYKFNLAMYGDGELRSGFKVLVERLGLSDCVKFHGNVPNNKIQQAMQESDIFLFTSDQQEGWGAVANEAMSNGCCLIGADKIGAVPYLVKDGTNGLIFKSCDLVSLYEKTIWAIDHPEECHIIRKTAVETMREVWSPANAARSLLQLIDDLQHGRDTSIKEGPCSKA